MHGKGRNGIGKESAKANNCSIDRKLSESPEFLAIVKKELDRVSRVEIVDVPRILKISKN